MKRAFGAPDPLQDARRVRTAAMLTDAINQSNPPAGPGAVENKIHLWPADGGQISTYDPDQAGLIAALAAAASGDTVWLPSIAIALTTGIIVPAGVAMIGISYSAILSFSGFSGTALTLAENSACTEFTISMLSNGATAIGVDLSAAGAVVDRMEIQAAGGSALNLAVDVSAL